MPAGLSVERNTILTDASSGTVLLYEDDAALASEVVRAFAAQDIHVEAVFSEADLRSLVASGRAAVLVIDRMIGAFDSLELLAELRAAGRNVPVVIISSRASVDDRILGLRSGGDDYLVKPFAMGELIARVEAQLRRAHANLETRIEIGSLILDRIHRTFQRGGREIGLASREFRLLEYLMLNRGQVVTRAMLLENVWNVLASTQTNVVDVQIGNLRRKLGRADEPCLIETVPRRGFRFVVDPPVDDA